MDLKKLAILALSIGVVHADAPDIPAQDAPTMQQMADVNVQKAQLIAINLQIQKECSKQIDFLTAIVQQVIGCIHKGSIPTSDKAALLEKMNAYGDILQQLQSMSVMTAESEALTTITIILKNIIDRLTLAVNSQLHNFEVPQLEELLIPDKNYSNSYDYVIKVLKKNDERIIELEKASTLLGLTTLNKAVRATESFIKNYKWPLSAVGILAGLSLARYIYRFDGFQETLQSHIEAIQQERHYKDYFTASAITVSVAGALFHRKLGDVGSMLIDTAYAWTAKKYQKLVHKIANIYDEAKGIKNIKRDGLATVLDNVPTLDDPSFFGLEYQMNQFKIILHYLEDSELYLRADNDIAKCLMLIGPSRTGKTAAAKALAATINQRYSAQGNKTKIQFIEVDYTLITNMASLKSYIEHAIANAPCILFIDEMHLLGLQKTGNKELLNEFLTQLTELHKIKDPAKQVFIIGATNHPELLAPELFKHERFGKVIRFKKPGIRERYQFFTSNLAKYGINLDLIDLASIVLQTKDCDYGHLQQIIKDARFEARAAGQGVNQGHLQRAINGIVHGLCSTAELSKEEAHIAAVDQAGKIIVHKKLGIHETIHLATISKVDGRIEEDHFWLSEKKDTEVIPMHYGAIISTSDREEIQLSDAQEIEKLAKRHLGGIAAQKVMLGTYHIDYTAQDYKTAFELAQKLILKGLTLKSIPQEQQNRVFAEAEKLLQRFEAEVIALVEAHKPLVEKLITELLTADSITGAEIDSIVH